MTPRCAFAFAFASALAAAWLCACAAGTRHSRINTALERALRPAANAPDRTCPALPLADPRQPSPDALALLEQACRADRACGCADLGVVLLSGADAAQHPRAVGLLLGACQAGALDACASLRLLVELCQLGAHADASHACGELVRRELLEAAPRLELAEIFGCWRASGPAYTRVCLEPRRAFLRLPSGAWDGLAVDWQRVSATLVASAVPESGATLGVGSRSGPQGPELRLELTAAKSRLDTIGGFKLTATDAAEQRRLRAVIAQLPDPHQACEGARRCVDAANALLNPADAARSEQPLVSAVAVTQSDRLYDCSVARAQALEFLAASKLSIPEECR